MKWFTEKRSKKMIDRTINGIEIFQKIFAIIGLIATFSGVFFSPYVYAAENNPTTTISDNMDNSNKEKAGFYDVKSSDIPLDIEVESLRKINEKVFKKLDGTYEVSIYSDAVHYQKDGKFVDIDNTLLDSENDIYNKDNIFNISFPKTLNQNDKIKLTIDDYKINWRIINAKTSNSVKDNRETNRSKKQSKSELSKLISSVKYENVLPNTHIEYLLTGSKIKENIYVNSYKEHMTYEFEYEVKNLRLIETAPNNFAFVNSKEEIIFTIDEMYMIDSLGKTSSNIKISVDQVKKDTYKITIIPDDEFLKHASYPVLIDPTITTPRQDLTVSDTYVAEWDENANYHLGSTMRVGGGLNNEFRSIIRFTTPTFLNEQVITYAHMELKRTDSVNSDFQVNIYKNTVNFDMTSVSWNSKPLYEPTPVDYFRYNLSEDKMLFDITESVKDWQAGLGGNYGFTLVADTLNGTFKDLYQFNTATQSNRPVIKIGYESPSGLKDYWTYTSQELGSVGTGYVSDYTGNLTFVRNEYQIDSEFMGLNLSFVYSNASRMTNIGYGKGWKTNFDMRIYYDSNSYRYYLDKPDGNKIFFTYLDSYYDDGYTYYNYISEDGSRMKLERVEGDTYVSSQTIKTMDHISYEFDLNGKLIKILNTKTQHYLSVFYSKTNMISSVTDLIGNRIDFTYSAGLLSKTELKLKQPGTTTYSIVHDKNYFYTSNNLSYITQRYNYSGGVTANFSTGDKLIYYFDSYSRLNYAYNDTSKQKITYSYTTNHKVSEISATDISTGILNLSKLTVSYTFGKTTYTNQHQEWIEYLFDDYGHTINMLDSYGNATYQRYAGLFAYDFNNGKTFDGAEIINLPPNYYTYHAKLETSNPMKQQINYVKNHGFEDIDGDLKWYGYGGNIYKEWEIKVLGEASLKVNGQSSLTYAAQTISLPKGVYTLSGMVLNTGGSSEESSISVVKEGNTYSDSTSIKGKWEQLSVNFELTTAATISIRLTTKRMGTETYFDNIQLTEGFIDTRYNALSNASFEQGLTNWTPSHSTHVSHITDNTNTGANQSILGTSSIKIEGDGGTQKYLYQDMANFMTFGETYVIGGFAKADSVPQKGTYKPNNGSIVSDSRFFGIYVVYEFYNSPYPSSDTPEIGYIYLPFDTSTEDWQYQMRSFKIDEYQVLSVKLYLSYQGEGYAYFDNIQLYHDKLSTAYDYNLNNGNIISKNDANGLKTTYIYNSSNDIIEVNKGNEVIKIDYNSNYLIEEFSVNNVRTSFIYSSATKQITDVYIGDQTTGGEWFKTSTTYSIDKQYATGYTDEFGNTTISEVNHMNGLISSITKANSDSVSFIYDNYGNLINQTEFDSDNNYQVIKNFTYDDHRRISGVSIDGVTYEFTYDDLDRITLIKIAGIDYFTTSYINEQNGSTTYQTGKVDTQIYGNGAQYEFIYTTENQIKTVIINGEDICEYVYDQAGRLVIYKDLKNNQIYFYTYDLSGKIKQVMDQDNNSINYTYDENGNINQSSFDIYGRVTSVYYVYNETTGDYDYTYYETGVTDVTKNYVINPEDSLKRIQQIELIVGSHEFVQTYDYKTPSVGKGNASTRVSAVTYYKDGISQEIHYFTYDQVGNIIDIFVQNQLIQTEEHYHYTYDGFNRMIREDVSIDSEAFTNVYTYDNYLHEQTDSSTGDNRGNLTSIKTYNYGLVNGIPLRETKMYYNHSVWKDQVTKIENYQQGILVKTKLYSYDEIGNVTSISSDILETLVWKGRDLESHTIDDTSYTYTYNDQGIRVSKKHEGLVTYYFVEGNNVLAETTNGISIYYTYDVDGSIMSMYYQGAEYFYIKNLQGDIIEIIDIEGTLVAKYRYDAWGNIIYQYDSGLNISEINPYRYRGYRYDSDTGLYYLNSRYYDPSIGRFMSADSINYLDPSSSAGLNLYAYCGNNPVMYLNSAGYNSVNANNSVGVTGAVVGANGSSSSNWNTSWWNWNGSWGYGAGSIYEASYGNFLFSIGVTKIALFNFTQKNFRIVNAQIDLVRAEYNVNDYALIHATLGTAKAFIAFNSQDGFGAEAKLVILTVGAKAGPIGINFDIGAMGVTAKYVNGELEVGASAVIGFTISINVFEAWEWIKEHGGARYVLIN